MNDRSELPIATSEREQLARKLFPYREQTPDEYAARKAHEWLSFSFDDFRYSDVNLDAWIARLGQILFKRPGAPSLESLRAKFLTPLERESIDSASES